MRSPTVSTTRQLSLRWWLVVPFLIQIFATVGLVGYLSFVNGQKTVTNLANRLMSEVNSRVDQHLDTYLATPYQINQINVDAIEMGGLNVQDLPAAGRYFWKQMQVFPNVSFIGYALTDGRYAGAGRWIEGQGVTIDEVANPSSGRGQTYATDRNGNRTKVLLDEPYEPLSEAWYSETIQAGKPLWSQIYVSESEVEYIAASANRPIYGKNRRVIGVIGVDLLLSNIGEFLQKLKTSQNGGIFIVERDGLLVADSSSQKPYGVVNQKIERLNVLSSVDPLIRATAQQVQQQFGNFRNIQQYQTLELQFEGDRHFVQVAPWKDNYGLDWLVVIAVPESEFMGQINANTRTTIFLCLGALALATLLGILTSYWIAQPIRRLSTASQAIAAGDLEQTVEIRGAKEIRVLAKSFNRMAAQLRQSFQDLAASNSALAQTNHLLADTNSTLELNNEDLEQRVQERTAELQKAKEMADQANQAKSDFLARMSHDLRTPLNGILGYTQVLQRDKAATAKQKDGLNVIYQCGKHLSTLISDILDLSKIEAGKLELAPQTFSLEPMLHAVRDLCSIQAEQKNIGFKLQILNQLPLAVYGDETRLRQVLINLVGNAIKFTDQGEVKLKVGRMLMSERPSRYREGSSDVDRQMIHTIRFQVEDTGIGMTPKQLDTIFLPFEQAGEMVRQAQGTGLGLAISRTLVQLMGSEIKVRSDLGAGSMFWFTLDMPAVAAAADAMAAKGDRVITGYEGPPRTILLVDDRWENRAVVADLLKPLGFSILEAQDGQEGISQAKMCHPDAIITDLAMPVMDGLEMTQLLRRLENFKEVPIIASSAYVFNYDRQRSEAAGCNTFIPKPVQATELFEMLQQYLGLIWKY
jgi:hypothetical protein